MPSFKDFQSFKVRTTPYPSPYSPNNRIFGKISTEYSNNCNLSFGQPYETDTVYLHSFETDITKSKGRVKESLARVSITTENSFFAVCQLVKVKLRFSAPSAGIAEIEQT